MVSIVGSQVTGTRSRPGSPRNNKIPEKLAVTMIGVIFIGCMLIAFAYHVLPDPSRVVLSVDVSLTDERLSTEPTKPFAFSNRIDSNQADEDWRAHLCPVGSEIVLLFPHVNKAGGRSIESTFESQDNDDDRHRYVSNRSRSRTHTFDVVDHHRTYRQIAASENCYEGRSNVALKCEVTRNTSGRKRCPRWVFTVREPVARMVSAFYTIAGRASAIGLPPVSARDGKVSSFSGRHHFFCGGPKTRATRLMDDPTASIEDWARLPAKAREACSAAFNLHTKYLASEEKDGSRAQLEVAKRRLAAMSWFAVLERWQESMQLFAYSFRTDLVHYSPVSNYNPYDKNLSALARQVLMEHNKLDLELYEFATELFQSRIASMQRNKHDFFSSSYAFKCDEKKICWDKLVSSDSWVFDKKTNRAMFASVAKQKERLLCAPETGCTREDWKGDQQLQAIHQLSLSEPAHEYPPKSDHIQGQARQIPRTDCLASSFIIGSRKGGTTSLYQYLSQHPRFYGVRLDAEAQAGELLALHQLAQRPNIKPLQLRKAYDAAFVRQLLAPQAIDHGQQPKVAQLLKPLTLRESKLAKESQWYQEINEGKAITGESSVANGPACAVPAAMKVACGDNARFIYIVRDPIERIISQYKMRFRLGTISSRDKRTLEEHILDDLDAVMEAIPRTTQSEWWTCSQKKDIPCLFKNDYENSVWSSMYIVHLARWLCHYRGDNMLVLKSEELFAKPALHVQKALSFLGLEPHEMDIDQAVSKKYNAAPNLPASGKNDTELDFMSRPMTVSGPTLRHLHEFFRPYNQALSERFAIDTSSWDSSALV